ncbi:MAG: ABC-F family ATP-binding cassette domain-containing protein [Ignavibacteriae bacterium]|nr:ABC-F family ATP-binding cassette domain-containing protein [Ignavibacteriota bacterium]
MIDIINLSIQFNGNYLFENINLKILPDDKIAFVGSNGAGKSTLLKMIAQQLDPEDGKIQIKKKLKIGFLPQEIIPFKGRTVFDEVKNSLEDIKIIDDEENVLTTSLSNQLDENSRTKIIEKIGVLNHKKEEIGYYEIDSKIEKILSGLGFSESDFARQTIELSGGWQMRIELAKILVANNDVILLDEPTNHLDIDSLTWLVKFLKSFKGAIILVSHDRYFVNNICNKTLEIFNKNVTFYKGNYDDYLSFKVARAERLKEEYADQQKKIKQTEQFIERFRYKSTKAKQVQSRVKQLEKVDRIQLMDNESNIHFKFFDSPQSGVLPIEIDSLTKRYEDNLVLENLALQVERGEKIAFLGPNGAGKTTLAKILSNRLDPTLGNIKHGHNTIISFYAQDVVDNLNLENDIITELSTSDTESTIPQLRTILGAFLFNGDDVFKKIKVLSGGEKSRVALAKVLLTKANTIILDEPTNHLDFDSKKILQNALIKFNGTLIIISHDIDFLVPIISKVVEVRNKGIKEYFGGIDYYLSKREKDESNEIITKTVTSENSKVSRKEQKKLEAKLRQKEFKATNNIKKQISTHEELINELEELKQKLENDFAKEEVYSNPERAKQNKIDYEKAKNDLDNAYTEWTELSEELEKINNELH